MRKRAAGTTFAGLLPMPERLNTLPVLRMRLYRTVTSLDVDHGAEPSWFSDLSTKANPFCASDQLFSITFPSMRIRRTFFVSTRFFTCHFRFHESGRVM